MTLLRNLVIVSGLVGSIAAAEGPPQDAMKATQAVTAGIAGANPKAPLYVPPKWGAPGGRVGGGSRGEGGEVSALFAVAPDHVGLTLEDSPSLLWYLPTTTRHPIELTLIEGRTEQPLLETRLPPPQAVGLQRIRLKDFNVKLSIGTTYQWFVSVVPNQDRRSKDIVAGGTIARVAATKEWAAQTSRTERDAIPQALAEAGIWYDAVASISDLIDARPDDRGLRQFRAALLAQVGLSEVAEFELSQRK